MAEHDVQRRTGERATAIDNPGAPRLDAQPGQADFAGQKNRVRLLLLPWLLERARQKHTKTK